MNDYYLRKIIINFRENTKSIFNIKNLDFLRSKYITLNQEIGDIFAFENFIFKIFRNFQKKIRKKESLFSKQNNLNIGTSLRKQIPLLHMLHLSSFLATSRDNLKQVLKKNKDSL